MQRVETYFISKTRSKTEFSALADLCHKAKNLYNAANYVVRQALSGKLENIPEYSDLLKSSVKTSTAKDGRVETRASYFISEYDLSKRMCALKQADYKALKAQCSQQTIGLLFKNYKAFFKASADYSKNKAKYLGRPKLPKYKDKSGMSVLVYTNQCAKIDEDGHVKLAKDLVLKTVQTSLESFQQIRVVPMLDRFKIEIVHEQKEGAYAKQAKTKNRMTNNAAVDLGVGNLAAATSDNVDSRPLLVNGRSLKSSNQFWNMKIAKLKSEYAKHKIRSGKKMQALNRKRHLIVLDFMHKASRRLVDWCILNDVKTLFIGRNIGWKQETSMSKANNQNFVSIPHYKLISMLQYKCEDVGIEVKTLNEAYTSKCSALDHEPVGRHETYRGKREKQGLFKTSAGKIVNADVNGSLNILRLGLGKDFTIGSEVFNPMRLKNLDELCDAAYFRWQPADSGCVSQPNSQVSDELII